MYDVLRTGITVIAPSAQLARAAFQTNKLICDSSAYPTSSETHGQSVGSGEKAQRKFSSMGGRAPGYRLSPDRFQTAKNVCFVLLCPIGEQDLLSSFRGFVHDGYYLATVARFVHQAFLTRNEGTTDESKNVSDAISRSNLICTEKILFLTDHNVS